CFVDLWCRDWARAAHCREGRGARADSQPPGRSVEPMSVPRTSRASTVAVEDISRAILVLRGHKVLLDAERAALYGVTTKRLNEQVKRNAERFPEDFMFRLTR